MSNIVKGRSVADLVVLQGTRLKYVPGVGNTVVTMYSAQTLDAANAFYGSMIGGTNAVDLNRVGPPYIVEVSAPEGTNTSDPNDDYVDTWTMPKASASKSLFELDVFRRLSAGTQRLIREWDKSKDDADYVAAYALASANSEIADADAIITLLTKGTDSFFSPQTSVLWTRTVSGTYNDSYFASDSIGYIWTTSQLLNLNPPALISSLISISANAMDTPDPGYQTGWLKQAIDVSQRGNSRFDVSQEWVLENWSNTIYFTKT